MPALPPYIPRREADLNEWLANFSTLVSANYPAYGLLQSDAETIAALTAQWTAAYMPVTSPDTKTAVTVQAKNIATASVLPQIRVFAQRIANCPGVSADDKIALQLNPRTSPPAPITAPNTFPALLFQQATPLAVVLRYRDAVADVSGKAKPYGVIHCQVFGMASDTPITGQSTLPLVATPTKSPFILSFSGDEAGRTFYAAARWATRTGLVGPWSSMIRFTVVA